MINYKLKQNNFKNNSSYGRYFAQAITKELINTEALAKLMKKRNLPYSSGTIKGILDDMVDCIKEQLLAGNSVKIDDLAIFSIGIRNIEDGAETEKEFKANTHIKGIYLTCRAAGELMSKNMKVELQFNKIADCDCDKGEEEQAPETDQPDNGGNDNPGGGGFAG